jgi:hypothetical protein
MATAYIPQADIASIQRLTIDQLLKILEIMPMPSYNAFGESVQEKLYKIAFEELQRRIGL